MWNTKISAGDVRTSSIWSILLSDCSQRKCSVWTGCMEGRAASTHSFLLWGRDNELHFLKSILCSQKGKKKSTYRQEFAPKTPVPNKPTKILLQCLWERGSQLAEKQSFRAPCPCAPVSLESSGCSGQCDFMAVGRWVQVLCYSSPVWN